MVQAKPNTVGYRYRLRALFKALQREVRVSAGGWTESEEDDLFVRINGDGESRFLWHSS